MKTSVQLILLFVLASVSSRGQQQSINLSLTLKNIVELAINQSSAVKYTQNQNVNYYWRWRNHQTRFMPQLTLSGDMPNYTQTTKPITQPDGSIEFKQVSNMRTSAVVALNQSIPQTGTSIYASTSAYRVQDFNNNDVRFSGDPFVIGFTQPIFAYNWMKWTRKTEPLVYDEAQKNFIESIEEISLTATRKFFKYLKVQTNYNLAENNLRNSKDNLKIAQTKRKLGTISENDFSRIQLSVYNAQKALSQARMDLKNTDFELKSYIGLDQMQDIKLEMPLNTLFFEIDPQKALAEAKENRKESSYYERRLISADRDLTQAKRSTGLSATLRGSYGLSNSADDLPGIYDDPQKQRVLRLSLSIPLLDWGRSASTVKLAESKRDLVVYDVEKDRIDFEREVIVQVERFGLLKDQLYTAREADKVAGNGYQIALKKFQNGEISITELNISLSDREKAKRDYIASLQNYWEAYYLLRILTLYDFEMDQKIFYINPMLEDEI